MNVNVANWIGLRDSQEDAHRVKFYPEGVLVVVCDGMGGHQHGELASAAAVEAFEQDFSQTAASMPVTQRLQHALDAANAAVGAAFEGASSYGGTTLVAAYISSGVIWWVSVGDSLLHIWRRQRLLRLNEDHSMRPVYMQYVKAGALSYEEAMHGGHSLRSALTGLKPALVDISATPMPLLPGDRIILATDGADDILLQPMLSSEVKQLLSGKDMPLSAAIVQACQALKDPGADNVTVVSVDWP